MDLPSDKTIAALHKKYAPHEQALKVVYGHCRIIAAIAAQLIEANSLKVDGRLVRAAALLHDIGYYQLYDESGFVPQSTLITHGVVGAAILREEGLSETICRIAERHTGLGLTRANIITQHLPLPHRDFTAKTPEEELILYADKFHTKAVTKGARDTLGWFNSAESYLAHAGQFGKDNADRFTTLIEKYGTPNLAILAQKYNQPII